MKAKECCNRTFGHAPDCSTYSKRGKADAADVVEAAREFWLAVDDADGGKWLGERGKEAADRLWTALQGRRTHQRTTSPLK